MQEEVVDWEKTFVVNKIAGCLLFSVFGAMGFFYFLWRQNWNSAVWCLLLEIVCTVSIHFLKSYVKRELHVKYSAGIFRAVKYTAAVMTVCSWVAFIIYIVLGATWKEEFTERSHYAAAPIAFVAGVWYFTLFFDSRKYRKVIGASENGDLFCTYPRSILVNE